MPEMFIIFWVFLNLLNNEIIKLIGRLLEQRELDSPIDWNDRESDFDELEEIIINASKNEKLFELGDDFSDNCKVMLECISELNDDLTTYSGEDGDENEEVNVGESEEDVWT